MIARYIAVLVTTMAMVFCIVCFDVITKERASVMARTLVGTLATVCVLMWAYNIFMCAREISLW